MARIFISYRREDSSGYAGRLFDRLAAHFGEERVFMDIDSIEPGLDFVDVIQQTVASCDALVAVIGKQWLTMKDEHGRRRLDQPEDFVRLEIAAALERKVRVVPALVAGASMPKSTDLPDALKPLARRNALDLRDDIFRHAADRLIAALEKAIQEESPLEKPPTVPSKATQEAHTPKAGRTSGNWVRIGNFDIGKYPVTVAEYAKFVESPAFGICEKPPGWEKQLTNRAWPVNGVSWYDAEAYCQWAGCRLPAVSEWELAARGKEGRKYPWGKEPPDETRANYGNKVGHPTPVGSYPKGATPEGLMDMAGNVWEWCADWIDKEQMHKALRGGSWETDPAYLRSYYRANNLPGMRFVSFGFRCAREV